MATRSALSRLSLITIRSMKSTRGATRYFSDGKGRVLSEEERAAENVYIQAWPLISPFPISLPLSYCYYILLGCWESVGKWKKSLLWWLIELKKCFVVFVWASVCLLRKCRKMKEIAAHNFGDRLSLRNVLSFLFELLFVCWESVGKWKKSLLITLVIDRA
jgi:hypothetical protein